MKNDEPMTAQKLMGAYKALYRELYAVCYAILGSELSAGRALMDVMITVGERVNRKRAFDEAVRCALRYESAHETNYNYLEDVGAAPELANETAEARRCVMLVCGCHLSHRQAGALVGLKTGEVKSALSRAGACTGVQSEAKQKKELEKICAVELRRFPYVPDTGAFRRALENRLQREEGRNEIASGGRRFMTNVVALIMLLLIGFLIWSSTVLLNYFRDTAQNAIVEESDVAIPGTD